jgi:flavin-dependent dehydrogenase
VTGAACADVVVVGGGPSGSAAAITCAGAGAELRVVLVERSRFPRDAPGETLHPGVEPLLRRLGVADEVLAAGFLRHEGHWVRWEGAGPPRFEPFGRDAEGPWRGFQAGREVFDALLLARARALGVEVLQPCPISDVIVDGGRVAGVETPAGPIRARFVVDATGRRQWLARRLRLRVGRYSPRLVARYGHVEGDCPARAEAPAIVADPTGWTWTARVAPRVYQWTRLTLAGDPPSNDWLPEELRGLKRLCRSRGAEVDWRAAFEPAGPGYFLTGDAAAVLDPASSHGVLKALMSGMMAGHLIARVARAEATEPHAAAAYRAWHLDGFRRDLDALRALYARHPAAPRWAVESPAAFPGWAELRAGPTRP